MSPDIATDMSFDDFRNNRDPALDAVLSVNTEGMVADPIGKLRELFEAKDFDKVRTEATALANDARYKFVDFERELNDAGYQLLRGNRTDDAMFVFQLNTELFPNSPNVWDSLAECYWRLKDKDKAIQYYNKTI